MFYTFFKDGYSKGSPRAPSFTFVEIVELPITARNGNLFVIDRDEVVARSRLDGFARNQSATTIIFVDSIVYKIKLVPHMTIDTQSIGIRMWESR
jgi:hypothetical protein